MNEKIQIIIDGGNFYHLVLKKLGIRVHEFDFNKFANYLAENRTITDKGKRYYTGTVREESNDPRSKKLMSEQTRLFSLLSKQEWELKTSKLRTRTEEIKIDERTVDYEKFLKANIHSVTYARKREKGIDVKIATARILI